MTCRTDKTWPALVKQCEGAWELIGAQDTVGKPLE